MWASEKVKRWEVCRPSEEVACDSRSCPAEMLTAANANSKQLAIRYRTPLITRSWRESCCDLIRVDSKGYRTATTKSHRRAFSRLLPSISRLEIFLCLRRGQALARERKARWMICCG